VTKAAWPPHPAPSLILPSRGNVTKWLTPNCNVGTNATLPTGVTFLAPLVVPSVMQVRFLLAQFTAAGDAGSLFQALMYADNGNFYPGEIIAQSSTLSTGSGNAGAIPTGGVPGVYSIPRIMTLNPGVYWLGGSLTYTTQAPTMACGTWAPHSFPMDQPPADMSVPASGLRAPRSSAAVFPLGATATFGPSVPALALGAS
jgi:hypothetical protein